MKLALLFAVLLSATAGAADVRQVQVTGPRIALGDVVPGAPASLRAADLGPAPAPGGSRVVSRAEIERALGHGTAVRVPDAVRVVRKMRALGATELAGLARPAIAAALPAGIRLGAIHAPATTSVAAGYTRAVARLPRLPHHAGASPITAMIELRDDGELLASLPVRAELDVSAEAARWDVEHDAPISIVIRRGLIEVAAPGVAGADGDLGDIIQVTVPRTGRTLRARIVAKDRALVLEAP